MQSTRFSWKLRLKGVFNIHPINGGRCPGACAEIRTGGCKSGILRYKCRGNDWCGGGGIIPCLIFCPPPPPYYRNYYIYIFLTTTFHLVPIILCPLCDYTCPFRLQYFFNKLIFIFVSIVSQSQLYFRNANEFCGGIELSVFLYNAATPIYSFILCICGNVI